MLKSLPARRDLIAAGISVAVITVVGRLGSKLNTTFGSVEGALN